MFFPLRDDTPRLRFPAVTVALIIANTLVFLYQMTLLPWEQLTFARGAGAVPWEISHFADLVGAGHPRDLVPPPFTLYTSMFVHGDVLHLAGNMWFLWLFGNKLEGYMGWLKYLVFYFIAGTVAGALQVAASPDTVIPMIGASGAIAGILGAYAMSFPRARVVCLVFLLFFVTFVTLPAAILLALWFLGQFAAAGGKQPGIAWYAHVGGFVAGLVLARLFVRPPRRLHLVYHPAT